MLDRFSVAIVQNNRKHIYFSLFLKKNNRNAFQVPYCEGYIGNWWQHLEKLKCLCTVVTKSITSQIAARMLSLVSFVVFPRDLETSRTYLLVRKKD
ncbi:hypothetical protein BDA96_02G104500 [Sorghum bicolor]|uniref:Uncharacterized protein n=1 Tax=Sorghum bicolor TaxID=4558 RepID=A0A921US19_SORBI|nr:hypothetical protein BDA96_02G104500 [Sorghum bicolor]